MIAIRDTLTTILTWNHRGEGFVIARSDSEIMKFANGEIDAVDPPLKLIDAVDSPQQSSNFRRGRYMLFCVMTVAFGLIGGFVWDRATPVAAVAPKAIPVRSEVPSRPEIPVRPEIQKPPQTEAFNSQLEKWWNSQKNLLRKPPERQHVYRPMATYTAPVGCPLSLGDTCKHRQAATYTAPAELPPIGCPLSLGNVCKN